MLIYRELKNLTCDATVLDVGTKDGRHLPDISGDVIAVDLDLTPTHDSVEYVTADGTQLPFPDGIFDYVVCNQVLEHIKAKGKLVAEIRRVLAPDGIFLVSFPNRLFPLDPHGFPPGFPWLPRSVALRIANRLSREQYKYYRDHAFYISAPRGRRLLSKYFDTVEYATLDLIQQFPEIYEDSKLGRILIRLLSLFSILNRIPGGSCLFEFVFGYTSYRCRTNQANS